MLDKADKHAPLHDLLEQGPLDPDEVDLAERTVDVADETLRR